MRKPIYHTFRGRRYRIRRVPRLGADGLCDHPQSPDKEIVIRQGQGEFAELEALMHEMDHACHWDLSEDAVDQAAHDKARALWREGYRKTVK